VSSSDSGPAYTTQSANRFFRAARSIIEYEIRPGNMVTLLHDVDLTEVERLRKAAGETRPSYTAFVVKAVALALREFPYANRRLYRIPWLPFFGTRLQLFTRCDVTVASERDIPGAEAISFADVLRNADQLSLAEITTWLRALATSDTSNNKQWREFSTIIARLPHWLSTLLIRLPHYSPKAWVKYRGGAALVSSPAKYGADAVVTTWPWPVGVSFGLVKQRAVVHDGAIVARPIFTLTLSFDRRLMAGAQGARFFNGIVMNLEQAETKMAAYLPSAASAIVPPDGQSRKDGTPAGGVP